MCGQPFVLCIILTSKHQNKINQLLTSVLLIGRFGRSCLAVLLVAGSATKKQSMRKSKKKVAE